MQHTKYAPIAAPIRTMQEEAVTWNYTIEVLIKKQQWTELNELNKADSEEHDRLLALK